MNKNRLHMVPQVVIDCAENFINTKNPNTRQTYETRLEAIREYCEYMLKQNQFSVSTFERKVRK